MAFTYFCLRQYAAQPTVAAAILIWLAAHSLPKARAAGIALLAYLAAAAIHGLNDTVINGPVRDWNIPLSLALTAIYAIAIPLFWFRPQVLRVKKYEINSTVTQQTGRGTEDQQAVST